MAKSQKKNNQLPNWSVDNIHYFIVIERSIIGVNEFAAYNDVLKTWRTFSTDRDITDDEFKATYTILKELKLNELLL